MLCFSLYIPTSIFTSQKPNDQQTILMRNDSESGSQTRHPHHLLRTASNAARAAAKMRRLTQTANTLGTNTLSISFPDNDEAENRTRQSLVRRATVIAINPYTLSSSQIELTSSSDLDSENHKDESSASSPSPGKRRKSLQERLLERSQRLDRQPRNYSNSSSPLLLSNSSATKNSQPDIKISSIKELERSMRTNNSAHQDQIDIFEFLSPPPEQRKGRRQSKTEFNSYQAFRSPFISSCINDSKEKAPPLQLNTPKAISSTPQQLTSTSLLQQDTRLLPVDTTIEREPSTQKPPQTQNGLHIAINSDQTPESKATILERAKSTAIEYKEELIIGAVATTAFGAKKIYDSYNERQTKSMSDMAAMGTGMTWGLFKGVGILVACGVGYRILRKWFCGNLEQRIDELERKQIQLVDAIQDHSRDLNNFFEDTQPGDLRRTVNWTTSTVQTYVSSLRDVEEDMLEIADAVRINGDALNHNAEVLERTHYELQEVAGNLLALLETEEIHRLFQQVARK